MNQLILNGVRLPEASGDKFSCWEEVLTRQVTMVTGRVVLEALEPASRIWRASYTFDYMGNDTLRQVLAVLRSGAPFPAVVLPDARDEPVSSTFICDSITNPTYAFSTGRVGLWHNLSFTIREEVPMLDKSAAYRAAIVGSPRRIGNPGGGGHQRPGHDLFRRGEQRRGEFSQSAQLYDRVMDLTPYATLEPHRWVLNGKFRLIPSDGTADQVGFVGDVLSGEDGSFSPAVWVEERFSNASILPGVLGILSGRRLGRGAGHLRCGDQAGGTAYYTKGVCWKPGQVRQPEWLHRQQPGCHPCDGEQVEPSGPPDAGG